VFWLTGLLAFVISPADTYHRVDHGRWPRLRWRVASHLYRAGLYQHRGGRERGVAFSPFGDITTLMVWQRGLSSSRVLPLFVPSLVNWLFPRPRWPCGPRGRPAVEETDIRKGGLVVVGLFLLTIAIAVSFQTSTPAAGIGHDDGLGLLKFYGYYLQRYDEPEWRRPWMSNPTTKPRRTSALMFEQMQNAEWDTLMFFMG
jgi:hypothetical protein